MATNSSKACLNITTLKHQRSHPTSFCIPWLVVLSTECLTIVILNIITITVFVKQRQLRRRSTYLIIHLAMVDLLVGAVSGPMQIHLGMVWCYGELESYDVTYFRIRLAIVPFFSFASLVNLTFISLERTHATYRPFNHRFIRNWVYGLIIAFIYLSTICKGAIEGITDWPFRYIWVFSSYFILLVVICVCYISIYIKVHCSHHPQHHGAAGLRERKLTSTLFFVTFASILSFLPVNIYSGISLHIVAFLKFPSHFQISITTLTLFLANSLVNPLIYVVRMPEFRAGISQMAVYKKSQNRLNPIEFPLRNL